MPRSERRGQPTEKPKITLLGCLLVYLIPILVMTILLDAVVQNMRINRSSLPRFELLIRMIWSPMRDALDYPFITLFDLAAIGLYLVYPHRGSAFISVFGIVVWYYMALMGNIGLFD